MYKPKIIKDGDPAFGIEGTFQIHDTIYVLTDDADHALLVYLADFGYITKENEHNDGYVATLGHIRTRTEILSEFLDAAGSATNISSTFIVDMNYYNRSSDQMSEIAISRMSGFVKNMVDVSYDDWEDFINQARNYHAQDFIRGLAHWASTNSDKKPREVKEEINGKTSIILGDRPFNLTKNTQSLFSGGEIRLAPPRLYK